MRTFRIVLGSFAALLALVAASGAEIYKWVDRDGTVHFQDTPPPSQPGTPVQRMPEREPRVEPAPPPARGAEGKGAPATADNLAPAPAAAAKPVRLKENAQVAIYGASWCPYCAQAREFFRTRGIPFEDYDVEKDLEALRRKNELDPGGGIPVTVIDGQLIRGFSPAEYEKALRAQD